MIRFLILIFLLVPQISWGQSSLPPCPETGVKHNCFGTFTQSNGGKYVGEYRDDKRSGQGIEYAANGSVIRSGTWEQGKLVQSATLDTSRFPFNPSTQIASSPISASDTAKEYIEKNWPWNNPVNWKKVVDFCKGREFESTTPCLHSLGRLYYEGLGVPVGIQRDKELGVRNHIGAAAQGEFNSYISLGEILISGDTSLGKDEKTSCEFYEKAARLSHPSSWKPIVDCYSKGVGRERNFDKALLYAFKSKNENLMQEIVGQENLRTNVANRLKIASEDFPPCQIAGALLNKCFGTSKFPSGTNFTGQWVNGMANGLGIDSNTDGIYAGQWLDNKRNGRGIFILPSGAKYVGGFRNHEREGEGIEYDPDGKVRVSGIWKDSKLVQSIAIDTNRFPFNPSSPIASAQIPVSDAAKVESERQLAEAKERERQQAQAPQPQRRLAL
ncbi:MAG: hypothetical protein EB072_14290 [Betaproteobacteria bacterium]|nr:hypothetical protein [Betaproteobacteria bacterium]